MRRRGLIGLLLLAVLLLTAAGAYAADPLVPDRPTLAPAYKDNKVPLYDNPRYEPWNYTFEGDRFGYADYTSFYMWMNQLLVAKAWLVKLAIRSVEFTLTQDWFKPFAARAGETLRGLGGFFWQQDKAPFVVGALSLAGLWALVLYLRGRVSSMWASLGSTVLILGFMAMLLASGPVAAESAVKLSQEATAQVFGAIEKVAADPADANTLLVRSGDFVWRALVYEPWLQGQFGSPDGPAYFKSNDDNIEGGRMLRVAQDYRLQWFRECQFGQEASQLRYCSWWRYEFLPRRMALAVWTFVAAVLYAGTMLSLSAGVMLAQLSLLFFLALAPVWLMVALWWPGGGVRLLWKYLLRVLGALVSQAVLSATLGLLMLLGLSEKAGFSTQGWMLQSILLAAIGTLAFRFRYAWLSPFPVRSGGVEATGLWERLRGLVVPARQATGATAAAAATGISNGVGMVSAQPLPAFASIPAPPQVVQQAMVEVQRPLETGQVQRPAATQRDVVTTQMRLLREQLTMREERIRRESAAPERQEASGWEEPTPAPGRVSNGKAGRPNSGGGATAAQIPAQRPRS